MTECRDLQFSPVPMDGFRLGMAWRGTAYRYAGTDTVLEHAVGRTVYKATKHSAERYLRRNSGV